MKNPGQVDHPPIVTVEDPAVVGMERFLPGTVIIGTLNFRWLSQGRATSFLTVANVGEGIVVVNRTSGSVPFIFQEVATSMYPLGVQHEIRVPGPGLAGVRVQPGNRKWMRHLG
jgi:hypothetical protein